MAITTPYNESELRFALHYNFGAEWDALDAADQALIVRDCSEDGVEDIEQYRRNIGRGGLATYARCMRGRFAKEER